MFVLGIDPRKARKSLGSRKSRKENRNIQYYEDKKRRNAKKNLPVQLNGRATAL